eukprot:scaffold1014_cov260-Pinguiococcus_pyrenoidosus.AAC.6
MKGVLTKVLPPEQTQEVLTRVSDTVIRLVRETLASVFPETERGKKRIIDDLKVLTTSLRNENPNADPTSLQGLLGECAERFGVSIDDREA